MPIFSVLTSKIFGGTSLFLALFCAVLFVRGNVYRHEAATAKLDRDTWHTAFDSQKQAYVSAQAAAKDMATVARIKEETLSAQRAQDNDMATAASWDRVRVARDAYSAAHRVPRQAVAADSPAGSTGAPSQDNSTPGNHGSSADDELVWITQRDFDICTEDEHRLVMTYTWGVREITEGRAVREMVPVADFAHPPHPDYATVLSRDSHVPPGQRDDLGAP